MTLGREDGGGYKSRWLRGSRSYTSLVADWPEETVVINVRDARTLRPVVTSSYALFDALVCYWRESATRRLTEQPRHYVDRFTESFVGALLVSLLTPPDTDTTDAGSVPDDTSGRDDDTSTTHE
jgi:hypothetical protein